MSPKTLADWIKRAKSGDLPAAGSGAGAARRVVTEEQAELSRLRREVAELRMERERPEEVSGATLASESLRGAR